MEKKIEWIDNINHEYRKMRKIMTKQTSLQQHRDRLVDQLNWLKYQIQYYTENGETEKLVGDYNWVVTNFNSMLELSASEQIPTFEQLKRSA